jgi:hypothetical protein
MALAQKDQPLAGALMSILIVLVIILLEEMFGLLPEHVFAGFKTPYGYMLALPIAFVFGSVFARAPDDLERGDHLLHSWPMAILLLAGAAAVVLGLQAGTPEAFVLRFIALGVAIGWIVHIFQDKYL